MPIDPSIPLGVRPVQFENPLAIAMQVQQMRIQQEQAQGLKAQRDLLNQQRQQAIEDQASLDAAIKPGATLDQVLGALPGHMHTGIRKAWAEADEKAADAAKKRTDADAAERDYFGTLAAQVKSFGYDPTAARLALDHAKGAGHDTTPIEAQIDKFGIQAVVDGMLASSPKQRELATGERNAATSALSAQTGAERLSAEKPGILARGQVDQQVAAGTVGGLTPAQQAEEKRAKAQREIEQARLGLERKKFEAESTANLDLSPEARTLVAKQFAMTGQLPPMGMGKQAAHLRTEVINEAARMYSGLDLASQRAAYDSSKASLVALQKQRDALGAFEQTALKNLDVFIDLAKKVPDTGSPALNQPLRLANEKMFGGDTLAAYNTARRTVIPEFAKVLANPGLSGQLSDTARKEIEDVVSGAATLKQTIAAARVLRQDTQNRRQSYDDQITAIQQRIATPPGQSGPVDTGAPKSPAAPSFKVGDVVDVGGKKIKVSAIHADGTFDGSEVR